MPHRGRNGYPSGGQQYAAPDPDLAAALAANRNLEEENRWLRLNQMTPAPDFAAQYPIPPPTAYAAALPAIIISDYQRDVFGVPYPGVQYTTAQYLPAQYHPAQYYPAQYLALPYPTQYLAARPSIPPQQYAPSPPPPPTSNFLAPQHGGVKKPKQPKSPGVRIKQEERRRKYLTEKTADGAGTLIKAEGSVVALTNGPMQEPSAKRSEEEKLAEDLLQVARETAESKASQGIVIKREEEQD
ncbi:MAG: hypothetical protein L6R37_007526 [Teloschistes peruensis]|nr:MAG: hypothetical protein L6R37_007526 [Teloschistes peruensis]